MISNENSKMKKKDIIPDYEKQLDPLCGPTKQSSPEAWFVGPRGENYQILNELVSIAIKHCIDARMEFNKNDELIFDEEFKKSEAYTHATEDMKNKTNYICKFLKKSLPFSSFRYQGHMNSDVLIPAVVGFISAMIYNPNNCCHQGSPTTTHIEIACINDLNRMVGFRFADKIDISLPKKEQMKQEMNRITPFGHIASGGSVANAESLWSAYWVKFIPLALKEAIKQETSLEKAKMVNVKLPNGLYKNLLTIDSWEGANIDCDECVKLPYKVAYECDIEHSQVIFLLKQYHPSNIGSFEFFNTHRMNAPVFLAPTSCHYSIPKSVALLGLGVNSLKFINVDDHFRMDLNHLKEMLVSCLYNKIPVINVVCVMGTTEVSSVDDLDGVLSLRKNMRQQYCFDFSIHSDSAYGGYFTSCIRKDYKIDDLESDILNPSNFHLDFEDRPNEELNITDPELYLSDYFIKQLKLLPNVDTIIIDSHKLGYVQYPAGCILYRNGKFKDILSYSGAYIISGIQQVPRIGNYCIEGSRPGAAAAAVYLAHSVVRTSKIGYGMLLKRTMLYCKLFYLHLLWLASSDSFIVTTVNPPLSNIIMNKIKEMIMKNGNFISYNEISSNRELLSLLKDVGPDQNVLCYTFNFKNIDGTINKDYNKFKLFNKKVYERFNYIPVNGKNEFDFVITSTCFGPSYGNAAVNILNRVGITIFPNDYEVPLIRSSIMDVFVSESNDNISSFSKIMDILKSELTRLSNEMNSISNLQE